MRIDYRKTLEKLGVNRLLGAYETQPWIHYDDDTGMSCSAEIRIGPGISDIETEIQLLKDDASPKQIMLMRITPVKDNLWAPTFLKIKGQDYVNKVPNWEEKACNFFRACVQSLQMNEMPNIDNLLENELYDEDTGGGGRGKIGRKSPKINHNALLGLKKGM